MRAQDGGDVLSVRAGAVPHSMYSSVTRDECSLAGCLSLRGGVGGTREGCLPLGLNPYTQDLFLSPERMVSTKIMKVEPKKKNVIEEKAKLYSVCLRVV